MELHGTDMKAESLAKWAGTAAALLLLAFDASAQGPSRPPPGQGDGAGPQRMAPAARPAQFAAEDDAAPRGGKMSREERRQLRRDVDQAGRDLYPPERRRGGRHPQNPPPLESAPAR